MTEKEEIVITGDKVLKYTPIPTLPDFPTQYRVSTIITKKVFVECFRKWIKDEVKNDKG